MDTNNPNRSKLKGLYAQKSQLTEKLSKYQKEKVALDENIEKVSNKLTGIQRGIDHLEGKHIFITTHFLEQYRLRIGPGTESEIKERVVTPQLINMIRTLGGNGSYPIGEYTVICEDSKLLTIYKDISKKEKMKQKYPGK